MLSFFDTLDWAFADDSLLFIKHKPTEYFLQFQKYTDENGKPCFHFSFPDAPWSTSFFKYVVEALSKEGINGTIIAAEAGLPVKGFFDFNFPADKRLAVNIVEISFNAMGVKKENNLVAWFEGSHKQDYMKVLRLRVEQHNQNIVDVEGANNDQIISDEYSKIMHLTIEHLKIYKHYHGDIDMWVRSRMKGDKIMSDELWGEIDQLLSRLDMKQKGLASDSFNAETKELLSKRCASSEVEQELIEMVGKY